MDDSASLCSFIFIKQFFTLCMFLADEVTKLVSSIASGLLLLSRSQEPSPDGNKGCSGSCQVLFKGFENLWIDFAEEYFFNELERVLSLLRGALPAACRDHKSR